MAGFSDPVRNDGDRNVVRAAKTINAEMANPEWDEVRVQSLKKEKLRVKDELERLRGSLH